MSTSIQQKRSAAKPIDRHTMIVAFMLACAVIIPELPVPYFGTIRVDELIAVCMLPRILSSRNTAPAVMRIWLTFLMIAMVFSMIWGIMVLKAAFDYRDLMEYVRLLKFVLYFKIGWHVYNDREYAYICKTLAICILLAALVGVVQYTDLYGLGQRLQRLYGGTDVFVGGWRVHGTDGNPNYYGIMMAMGLLAGVNLFAAAKRYNMRILVMLTTACSAVSMMMTNSRTALSACAFGLVAYLLFNLTEKTAVTGRRKLIIMRFLIFSGIALAATLIVLMNLRDVTAMSHSEYAFYTTNPLTRSIFRFTEWEQAMDARAMGWEDAYQDIRQSPLFGWGPGKASQVTFTENWYVLTLRRYGAIGLIVHLALLASIFIEIRKCVRLKGVSLIYNCMTMTVLCMFMILCFASLLSETFRHLRIMGLFFLLLGIVLQAARHPSGKRK